MSGSSRNSEDTPQKPSATSEPLQPGVSQARTRQASESSARAAAGLPARSVIEYSQSEDWFIRDGPTATLARVGLQHALARGADKDKQQLVASSQSIEAISASIIWQMLLRSPSVRDRIAGELYHVTAPPLGSEWTPWGFMDRLLWTMGVGSTPRPEEEWQTFVTVSSKHDTPFVACPIYISHQLMTGRQPVSAQIHFNDKEFEAGYDAWRRELAGSELGPLGGALFEAAEAVRFRNLIKNAEMPTLNVVFRPPLVIEPTCLVPQRPWAINGTARSASVGVVARYRGLRGVTSVRHLFAARKERREIRDTAHVVASTEDDRLAVRAEVDDIATDSVFLRFISDAVNYRDAQPAAVMERRTPWQGEQMRFRGATTHDGVAVVQYWHQDLPLTKKGELL